MRETPDFMSKDLIPLDPERTEYVTEYPGRKNPRNIRPRPEDFIQPDGDRDFMSETKTQHKHIDWFKPERVSKEQYKKTDQSLELYASENQTSYQRKSGMRPPMVESLHHLSKSNPYQTKQDADTEISTIRADYKENGYHKNVAPPIKGGIEFSTDPFSQKSLIRHDFVNHQKPRSAIRREVDNIQPSEDKFQDNTESKLYVQHKQLPLIAKSTKKQENTLPFLGASVVKSDYRKPENGRRADILKVADSELFDGSMKMDGATTNGDYKRHDVSRKPGKCHEYQLPSEKMETDTTSSDLRAFTADEVNKSRSLRPRTSIRMSADADKNRSVYVEDFKGDSCAPSLPNQKREVYRPRRNRGNRADFENEACPINKKKEKPLLHAGYLYSDDVTVRHLQSQPIF